MIAVMGAAGNVGSKVARLLLEEGQAVRVLQHRRSLGELVSEGAEVVTGDAGDAQSLQAFFTGVQAAFVLLPEDVTDDDFAAHRRRLIEVLADALRESAVPHVVALSAVLGSPQARGPMVTLRELEYRLAELDASMLVLRPAMYMDYLLAAVPLIASQGMNGGVLEPDLDLPWIATRDVAREAAAALSGLDFTGHPVRMLLGPEDLSMRQVTRQIGLRLGRADLPYVQFPPKDAVEGLTAAGMSEDFANTVVDMQLSINEGLVFAGIHRTPETTTPTRLVEFLKEALPQGYEPQEAGR